MEIAEKLKTLAAKKKYTAKEREYIAKMCAQEGIVLNTLCPDCYNDAVIQLYGIYRKSGEPEVGAYRLHEGVDIILNKTERICAATLTDENAKRWLRMGLPLSYFAALPDDDHIAD